MLAAMTAVPNAGGPQGAIEQAWQRLADREAARLRDAFVRRADVPPEARVSCEEVFGPVVVIDVVDSLDEAFARVNDSRFGLQAGVFTDDLKVAFHAAQVLEVGGVVIGDVPSFRADQMPYGGVKDSGTGREGVRGKGGMEAEVRAPRGVHDERHVVPVSHRGKTCHVTHRSHIRRVTDEHRAVCPGGEGQHGGARGVSGSRVQAQVGVDLVAVLPQ